LEFAFFLPLYLVLIYAMIQICMAINGGHVLQQYTRTRLFQMLYNHADYPALRWTTPSGSRDQSGWQRFWVGMDKEKFGNAEENASREEGSNINPTIVHVGNHPITGDEDGNNFPPERRYSVRLRIISFICMPPKLWPALRPSDPKYLTDINVDSLRSWYENGFGTHVSFCQD
jgi:hypothetical protein